MQGKPAPFSPSPKNPNSPQMVTPTPLLPQESKLPQNGHPHPPSSPKNPNSPKMVTPTPLLPQEFKLPQNGHPHPPSSPKNSNTPQMVTPTPQDFSMSNQNSPQTEL